MQVHLQAGQELPNDRGVYFPVSGVVTLHLHRDEMQFQVGFSAKGDAIGLQSLFVPEFPEIRAKALVTGDFDYVSRGMIEHLMRTDQPLKDRLSAYALQMTARFLDEAAKAVALTLERRVARWITRCRQAVGSDVLAATHQELATSLGVRRSGVTLALRILEGQRLIRSDRGRIEIRDQIGLAQFC